MTFGQLPILLGSLTNFCNSSLRWKVFRTWLSGNGLPGNSKKKLSPQDQRSPMGNLPEGMPELQITPLKPVPATVVGEDI
jgi:hypothetical protein